MTAARTADAFVEVASGASTRARTTDALVEAVANPTTKARTSDLYVEVVVGGAAPGWSVGFIRIG